MGCRGLSWAVVGCRGLSWAVVGCRGLSWAVLGPGCGGLCLDGCALGHGSGLGFWVGRHRDGGGGGV